MKGLDGGWRFSEKKTFEELILLMTSPDLYQFKERCQEGRSRSFLRPSVPTCSRIIFMSFYPESVISVFLDYKILTLIIKKDYGKVSLGPK